MSNLARGSYTLRLQIPNKSGALAQVTSLIAEYGGITGAIDIGASKKNILFAISPSTA